MRLTATPPLAHHALRRVWVAGGAFVIPGDYLYRTFQSFQFDGGIWGIFRVAPAYQPPPPDPCGCTTRYCTQMMCVQPAPTAN